MRVQDFGSLPAILALSCALAASAADWLNYDSGARSGGWQKHEKILTVSNVRNLKLIWRLKLDGGDLATPAILGHWITNRGTKELVFAVSGSGNVYAVDGDLGRLFWTRRLPDGGGRRPAAPALAPGPAPPAGQDEIDDDDDIRQEVRPVYVAGERGRVYELHPTTGTDVGSPRGLVPPDALTSPNRKEPATAWWRDGWTFTAERTGIAGFKAGRRQWTSGTLISPAPPVVANGVVYALARGSEKSPAVLYAFDALTGAALYSSGSAVTSYAEASGLAVANGHVCFGTRDGTLYCFGFPVDL